MRESGGRWRTTNEFVHYLQAVRRAFSHYEFVRQWNCTDECNDIIENKEEYMINLLQNLWDLQHGIKCLEDELVERHCIEAIRLLVLLWIVHCFEKTETGQWQPCPTFYAELFGNSNPRQIIQNLYKSQLNNIEMTLLTDTLRIRLELLDCSYDVHIKNKQTNKQTDDLTKFKDMIFVTSNQSSDRLSPDLDWEDAMFSFKDR
ncbi:hypothetical protein ACH3XW_40590 [Acanthocheilonema viteae]